MSENLGYIPPTQLTGSETKDFLDILRTHLGRLFQNLEGSFSEQVQRDVEKMVAPSARENYRSKSDIARLLTGEVEYLARKAYRYQFLERYKFFQSIPGAEMTMSFHEHIWSARGAEVYSMLEKGEAVIRFASSLASECGAGDARSATRFAKQFRKRMEYRLKERHRMTHAHERPSLTARILQLGDLRSEEEKRIFLSAITPLVKTIRTYFTQAQTTPGAERVPDPIDQAAFQQWYLKSADEEAADMWQIVVTHLSTALDLKRDDITR